jgi:hypothetical protein
MSTAYPLSWPIDFPRTQCPGTSRFKPHSLHQAVEELQNQLKVSGATDVIISSNITLGGGSPKDKGICVYFKLKNRPYALPCDKWAKAEDNLWALAKYVEAARLQRNWGVGSLERDFSGYAALPAPISDKTPWHEVLKVNINDSFAICKDAYQKAAMRAHPDHGGSNQQMAIINRAWSEAKKSFGVSA